jgi:antitoxin MazE
MKTNIIRIGNSKGIRLPKSVLEQCHLKDAVEIEVAGNTLVLRPARAPRSGWDQSFAKMADHEDDTLLDQDALSATEWDNAEWRW